MWAGADGCEHTEVHLALGGAVQVDQFDAGAAQDVGNQGGVRREVGLAGHKGRTPLGVDGGQPLPAFDAHPLAGHRLHLSQQWFAAAATGQPLRKQGFELRVA